MAHFAVRGLKVSGNGLDLVDQQQGDTHVLEMHSEAVELRREIVDAAHAQCVPRDAVDHHDLPLVLFNIAADHVCEFIPRESILDLQHSQSATIDHIADGNTDLAAAVHECVRAFFEGVNNGALPLGPMVGSDFT